ncbi:MAG: hypothetical protein K2W82_16170 [Candidatus Obscuribacterales bacterium]|nr:hypothetical protein [Candidatus Obscuribacterales bacterium]
MQSLAIGMLLGIGFLLLSIFGSAWLASRLSVKTSNWLGSILAIAGAGLVIYYNIYGFGSRNIILMLLCFLPMYISLGFMIGNTAKKRQVEVAAKREQKQKELVAWEKLLQRHQQEKSNPLVIAADYQQIGQLEEYLGEADRALNAYQHADLIYRQQMSGHPSLADFYSTYARLLNSKVERTEHEVQHLTNGKQLVTELEALAATAERAIAELV